MKSFKEYITEVKKRKPSVDFDRIDRIDALANEYYEYDYRDMIYDILKKGTNDSDKQIAKELAMSVQGA